MGDYDNMSAFNDRLEFGRMAEEELRRLLTAELAGQGRVSAATELYIPSRHGIYADFDEMFGDLEVVTPSFGVVRIDVKRVESDDRHWKPFRKSFTINVKSMKNFCGDLYVGSNNAMTEFYVVQRELAKNGDQSFGPFYSIDVLRPHFKALSLRVWFDAGMPRAW